MTIDTIAEGQAINMEELVLEDVEIAIVDQVSDPTAYENCLTLCKTFIRMFKVQSVVIINSMLQEIPSLKNQGSQGQSIINNLVDILLILPQLVDETEVPVGYAREMLTILYEQNNYRYLARMIRKYYSFF